MRSRMPRKTRFADRAKSRENIADSASISRNPAADPASIFSFSLYLFMQSAQGRYGLYQYHESGGEQRKQDEHDERLYQRGFGAPLIEAIIEDSTMKNIAPIIISV